jgi:hypothetical protein
MIQRWDLITDTAHHRPFSSPASTDSRDSGKSECPKELSVPGGKFQIDWSDWGNGRSAGMRCLSIDTGALKATLLPDRGMGIWKCWAGGIEFGWQSPVRGPVHPALVPVHDSSGIGWLEGFDELVVRCGLLSNGAPEFDSAGLLRYPLHGRIANLPAHSLSLEVDREQGYLEVVGKVIESRFLIYSLELETRIRFYPGSSILEITDKVTNVLTQPGSMQLLYHINLGQPLLQSGSKIWAPLATVAPRDARAAEGIHAWRECMGPESGFSEQVYFGKPLADDQHWSQALLTNSDNSLGYSIHYDTRTLPAIIFWKNTAAVEDGYVLGIEPATGFPNSRSFEEHQGRVVRLQGGESRVFRMKLEPHLDRTAVRQATARIDRLQTQPCQVEALPKVGWSASAAGS